MDIGAILLAFFQWLFSQGAPVIVPLVIIILGLIFRAPLRRTLVCALRMGVGFTGLYAIIMMALSTLGPAGELMAKRYGVGLTIPDVGWPTLSSITFAVPFSMVMIASLILLNALLVAIGLTNTLNVDFFNHWPFVFCAAAILVETGNWVLAIASALIFWFITLKMADWTQPLVEAFYDMPGISIPHSHTVVYAPFGLLLNKLWDRIPKIRDVRLDPEYIRERLGIVGEPMVIGFLVGLFLGVLAYLEIPPTGDQVAKIISLSLSLGFFMLILPRCAEQIVMGLAPLSEAIRDFIMKRMPGRKFFVGLDVAVLVGWPEHIALGILAAPLCYLVAAILPGNRVIPLADAAGYMIFFTVWAVNTCYGNLFRGLLNALILWIPLSMAIANAWVPATMDIVKFTNFQLPPGTTAVTSLTTGSHFISYALYEISLFIAGKGTVADLVIGTAIMAVFLLVWYAMYRHMATYVEELKKRKGAK